VIAVAAVLPRFVRPGFAPAAGVFYWLAAAVLVSVVQAPLVAAALYLLRPNFLIVVNLVRVAATGGLGLALAPSGGAMGAAVAQLGGSLAGAAVLAVLVLTAIRTASTDSLPSEPPPR
jgi:O-antigen/teichoic acid export membrane protein